MIRRTLFLLAVVAASFSAVKAQAPATLFPYPVAPDTCTTLESRCNYITQRFWDNFDFTKPIPASLDSAVASTMTDYFEIMLNANSNIALSSIRNMLFKAQTNQPNFMKIVDMAEFILYKNPVSIVDDVYLTFAQAAADAKWMKNDQRNYYKTQIERISTSKLGQAIANVDVYDAQGSKIKLHDIATDSVQVVLLFFTGDGTASSISRVRMSTDVNANLAIQQGHVKLVNVVIGDKARQSVAADATQYPDWTVVAMPDAAKKLDLRLLPCVFVLDPSYVVLSKNLSVDEVKNMFNQ